MKADKLCVWLISFPTITLEEQMVLQKSILNFSIYEICKLILKTSTHVQGICAHLQVGKL